jgi:uncharacterized protein (TIGR00251 family)
VGVSKGGDSRTGQRPSWLVRNGNRWLLALHVQPGAKRTDVVGLYGERLKIAIAAPADQGRANARLIEFLAARLGLAKSTLELVSGASARAKRVALPLTLEPHQIIDALDARGMDRQQKKEQA